MSRKRIKVCHFTSVHNRFDVRIFHKECITLHNAGYNVHLLVADGKGNNYRDGIAIHDIGKMPNRLLRMVFTPLLMLSSLLSIKAQIYHFHDPELLFVALMLKLLSGAKIIYDAHENYSDYMLQKEYLPKYIQPLASVLIKQIESFIGKRMDWVVVTTEQHYNALQYINKNMSIVYNYPKLSEWKNIDINTLQKQERSICYVGNINRERGIELLINAIEKLDCMLHLAGNYEPSDYRTYLTTLPGWSKVIEHGYVDRDKASEIIAKSQIGSVLFLPLPIHYTSLSTKVFEYMAAGTACLVPDFPIWKSIIEKYDCGNCVDTSNIDSVIEAIEDMLSHPEKLIEMGQRGRKIVLEQLNWETQITEITKIYSTLSEDISESHQ